MAINITDFDKIWASTSPLTPYSFSDANYQEGWNFIGGTPPARQMWDFLQKQNDEKSQWLYNSIKKGNPVELVADDGNGNTSTFSVSAGGNASLNGFNVAIVEDVGYGYIKLKNGIYGGVQACWGAGQNATSAGISVTFGKEFPTGSSVRVIISSVAGGYSCWATDVTTTGFTAHSSTTGWVNYIAIANFS